MEVPSEKMYKKTIINSQSAIDVDGNYDEFLQLQSAVQNKDMMEKDKLNQKSQKFTVDITVEEVKEESYQFKSKQKIINRKRMWQVLESVSKNITDYADQQLAVEVINTWGRLETMITQDSAKEKKLQQALLKWQDWLRTNIFAYTGPPVFYKCYTCSKGWWRLYQFREHIEKHEEVLKIKVETTSFESSIVAYVGMKPLKKTVHIEGNCLKCSKGIKDHKFYRCYVCQFAFGNCTALYRHDCRKMRSRRGVILESLKLTTCSICGFKCKSSEMYNHKLLIHAVPSDEPMDFSPLSHSDCGMKYVFNDSHACPAKVREIYCNYCPRKFHNSSLSRLHMDIADSDIKCQVCSELLPRQCMLMEHLSAHSEHFAMVAKCAICTVPVVFPDEVSAKYHMKVWHDKIETRYRTYHDMVIIPKTVVKKWWNIDSMDPNTNYKEEDAVSDDETSEVVQSNHVNDTLQNNTEAPTDVVDSYNEKTFNNEPLITDLDQEMSDNERNENAKSNHVYDTLQNNTEAPTDVDSYDKKTFNNRTLITDLDQEMSDNERNENVKSNHVYDTLQNNTEAPTDVDSYNEKTFNNGTLKTDLDQEMSDNVRNGNVKSNHVYDMLQNNTYTDPDVVTNKRGTVNNEILINDSNGEVGDDFDMHMDVEYILRNPLGISKIKYFVEEAVLEEKPDTNEENENIGSDMADMQPALVSNDSSARFKDNILYRCYKCNFLGIPNEYIKHKKSKCLNKNTRVKRSSISYI